MKKVHPDTVLIIDNYDCYTICSDDCYVVYYLCKFSIKGNKFKLISNKITYLNYLVGRLEENHVNFMVLIKRHGYNVESSTQFLDNTYDKFCSKGKLVYKREQKVTYIKRQLCCRILEHEGVIKRIKELISSNGI